MKTVAKFHVRAIRHVVSGTPHGMYIRIGKNCPAWWGLHPMKTSEKVTALATRNTMPGKLCLLFNHGDAPECPDGGLWETAGEVSVKKDDSEAYSFYIGSRILPWLSSNFISTEDDDSTKRGTHLLDAYWGYDEVNRGHRILMVKLDKRILE